MEPQRLVIAYACVGFRDPERTYRQIDLAGRIAVVTGGDEGPRQPDPAGTLEIMRRLGARAEDTVFIGDSPTDVTRSLAGEATVRQPASSQERDFSTTSVWTSPGETTSTAKSGAPGQ